MHREGGRLIDHRTGGVRGFAPEPSYMAMTIIGLGVYLWFEKVRLDFLDVFLIATGVALCGSIVGYGALLIFLTLYFDQRFRPVFKRFFQWQG